MDKNEMLAELAEVGRLFDALPKNGAVSVTMYGDAQRAQIAAANLFRTHHAEIEAMARDAARYRWMRDDSSADRGMPFIAINLGSISRWTGSYADKQVDAAMFGHSSEVSDAQ